MCGSEALVWTFVCLLVPQGLWAATSVQGGDNRVGDKWKLSSSTPNFVGIRTKNLAQVTMVQNVSPVGPPAAAPTGSEH